MKKLLALVMSVLMLFSLCSCGSKTTEKTTEETATEAKTEDKLTEYDSLKKAESAAGFDFNFKDVIGCGAYYAKEYRAKDGMIEVTYYSEDGDSKYVIRQATLTDEDISEDDTEYSHDFTDSDAGVDEVRLRGTKDQLAVCSFNYEDYSYVIYPGDMDYNETFLIIGEMTGVDPTTYTTSQSQDTEEEPTEGAPVVGDERTIDEKAIDVLEIAGEYSGVKGGKVTLDIYTDADDAACGIITIYNKKGKKIYKGEIQELSTNYYGMMKEDVNFTVYTERKTIYLEVYVDGEHYDDFTMEEHYES